MSLKRKLFGGITAVALACGGLMAAAPAYADSPYIWLTYDSKKERCLAKSNVKIAALQTNMRFGGSVKNFKVEYLCMYTNTDHNYHTSITWRQ